MVAKRTSPPVLSTAGTKCLHDRHNHMSTTVSSEATAMKAVPSTHHTALCSPLLSPLGLFVCLVPWLNSLCWPDNSRTQPVPASMPQCWALQQAVCAGNGGISAGWFLRYQEGSVTSRTDVTKVRGEFHQLWRWLLLGTHDLAVAGQTLLLDCGALLNALATSALMQGIRTADSRPYVYCSCSIACTDCCGVLLTPAAPVPACSQPNVP